MTTKPKHKPPFTVGTRNGVLNTLTFRGVFQTMDDATAYARRQNLQTREWCHHEVWEGTASAPRAKVLYVSRDD